MHRILVATDGTAGSRSAARLAGRLAQLTGAEVVLVHVSVPPVLPQLRAPAPEALEVSSDAERERAFAVAGDILEGFDVAYTRVGLVGQPAASIVELATQREADLVVVGRSSETALERLLLGSVAEGVVRRAPCHVLVASPDAATYL